MTQNDGDYKEILENFEEEDGFSLSDLVYPTATTGLGLLTYEVMENTVDNGLEMVEELGSSELLPNAVGLVGGSVTSVFLGVSTIYFGLNSKDSMKKAYKKFKACFGESEAWSAGERGEEITFDEAVSLLERSEAVLLEGEGALEGEYGEIYTGEEALELVDGLYEGESEVGAHQDEEIYRIDFSEDGDTCLRALGIIDS